jgi:hypothetical protein
MFIDILPYIEQLSFYNAWKMPCGWRGGYNWTLINSREARVATMRCPSDTVAQNWAQCNYGFSTGPDFGWDWRPNTGMFDWNQTKNFAEVKDGLSNTIMLGEKLDFDPQGGVKARQNTVSNVAFPANVNDDTLNSGAPPFLSQAQLDQWGQAAVPGLGTGNQYNGCCWSGWNGLQQVNTLAPPNWKYPNLANWGCTFNCGRGVFTPRSSHPGGVNVALGDASVRFISETIDLLTWQCLGGRRDGQAVAVP